MDTSDPLNMRPHTVYRDALFLDELPAGSKLYFCDGDVVIAYGPNTSSRGFYIIRSNGIVKDYECTVDMIKPGDIRFKKNIQNLPKANIEDATAEQCRISLLPTLFPFINESSMLENFRTDMAIEMATTLEAHPRIREGNYPIQYILILLLQKNNKAILEAIENHGGHITTTHLCDALGIPKLTSSMKKFIKMVNPCRFMNKNEYVSLIQTVLQQWHRYKAVFSNSQAISLWCREFEQMYKLLDAYPCLFKAKWFTVRQVASNQQWILSEEKIKRVYHFYMDDLKARNIPVPDSASSIDLFLTNYIRSFRQLSDLYDRAEDEFTENADDWLIDTYPDDYAFQQLPDFEDNRAFGLIRTAGQLRAAAKKLHNCAAGYLHEAAIGALLFFTYEYAPGQSPYYCSPDDPDNLISGLLALRRQELNDWKETDMNWSQLVEEFTGYRNEELGEHTWRDLESFLYDEF